MNTRCLLILIGTAFLDVFPIQAQWRIGGEVGVTMSRLKVKGSESVIGPTLGFTADYRFRSQVVVMSGLSLTRKGGGNLWNDPNYQSELYQLSHVKNYYLEVPLMVGYRFPVTDHISVTPSIGAYVAYGLSGTGEIDGIVGMSRVGEKWDQTFKKEHIDFPKERDIAAFDRWDSGMRFGLRADVDRFSLNIIYNMGFVKAWDGFPNMHHYDFYNRNFAVSLGYHFSL